MQQEHILPQEYAVVQLVQQKQAVKNTIIQVVHVLNVIADTNLPAVLVHNVKQEHIQTKEQLLVKIALVENTLQAKDLAVV